MVYGDWVRHHALPLVDCLRVFGDPGEDVDAWLRNELQHLTAVGVVGREALDVGLQLVAADLDQHGLVCQVLRFDAEGLVTAAQVDLLVLLALGRLRVSICTIRGGAYTVIGIGGISSSIMNT